MGNEQEERQQNKISKINEGDIGSDGEQNNKEKERKKSGTEKRNGGRYQF